MTSPVMPRSAWLSELGGVTEHQNMYLPGLSGALKVTVESAAAGMSSLLVTLSAGL